MHVRRLIEKYRRAGCSDAHRRHTVASMMPLNRSVCRPNAYIRILKTAADLVTAENSNETSWRVGIRDYVQQDAHIAKADSKNTTSTLINIIVTHSEVEYMDECEDDTERDTNVGDRYDIRNCTKLRQCR